MTPYRPQPAGETFWETVNADCYPTPGDVRCKCRLRSTGETVVVIRLTQLKWKGREHYYGRLRP